MRIPVQIPCDCGGHATLSSNKFEAADLVHCTSCHKLLEVSPYFYANRLVLFMPLACWILAIGVSLMPLLAPRSELGLNIAHDSVSVIVWGLVAFLYFIGFGPLIVKPIILVVWMRMTKTDVRRTRAKFAAFGGDHIAFGAHIYAFLLLLVLIRLWQQFGGLISGISPVVFYLSCIIVSLLGALVSANIFFRNAPVSQDAPSGSRGINF